MRVGLTIVFFWIFANVVAQQTADTTALEEVTVTAQRLAQPVISVPFAVSSLDSLQLSERQARTTAEALEGLGNVFVQKTNHGGGSPIIRGLMGNQILVLIDGIRLNNSTYRFGPNQYLTTIDPYSIEHVEVLRGSGAVQYGSDALGGVVQVFSKSPTFAEHKPVLLSSITGKLMSSGMESAARTAVDYRSKKIALTTGLSYRDFGDLIGGDTTGRQSPSGYKEWALNAKLEVRLTSAIKLAIAHQNLTQNDVPVYHKVKLENFAVNHFDKQQRRLQYLKLHANTKLAVLQTLEITASQQQNKEVRSSLKNGSPLFLKENDRVHTLGLTAQFTSIIQKRWSATSGAELYRDLVHSSRIETNLQSMFSTAKRGLYPNGAAAQNFALYTLHHFNFKDWIVDAGLRFNQFKISLADSSLGPVKLKPSATVWNIALLHAISKYSKLYLNYSTGFRAPNVDDLGSLGIVDFRYEIPTANLSPEKSANIEIGYKFKSRKFTGSFSMYQLRLSQLISRIKIEGMQINGYQVYKKENIDRANIHGVELDASWHPLKIVNIKTSIAYTHGVNKSKAEPLRRIPPVFGYVATTFRKKDWYTTAEVQVAGKQNRLAQADKDDNRININGTPAWTIVNIYSGINIKKHGIKVGFQNLFNQDYRTHGSGINGVGRSIWASMTIRF